MNYQHIAARVLNTPLLLEPGYARVMIGALAPRLGIISLQDEHGQIEDQQKLRMRADSFEPRRERFRPYQLTADGIAILPVSGSLVHKHGHLQPFSGMTGYDGLVTRLEYALDDPDVRGVLLDIDSPGGEVAGCFDCAAKIRSMRGTKPIGSIAYDLAASAAMAIHSATDVRYTTQSAIVGSVGVVMMHASMQAALKEKGIEVTLIHSGAFKVDGNPYQNLPEDVLKRFQAETDGLRQDFAGLVAENLGLSVEAVLKTEAAVYRGQSVLDVGFSDEIVNGHEVVTAFADYLKPKTLGARTMREQQLAPAAEAPENTKTQADLDKARTKAKAEAKAEERARVKGILTSDEAKGRTELAQHFAFDTDMDEKAAIAALAKSPESGIQSADTPLDRAMGATEQPMIGADGEQPAGEDSKRSHEVNALVGSFHKATGKGKAQRH